MAFFPCSDDLFDPIVMADDRFHNKGYEEGFEEGTRQGTFVSRNHGRLHGAQIGAEVSFYYGFAVTWKWIFLNNNDDKARKRVKSLESLIGVIDGFSCDDPQYQNLQEDLERVRAKFRQVCSLLNVPTDFRDYPKGSSGISF